MGSQPCPTPRLSPANFPSMSTKSAAPGRKPRLPKILGLRGSRLVRRHPAESGVASVVHRCVRYKYARACEMPSAYHNALHPRPTLYPFLILRRRNTRARLVFRGFNWTSIHPNAVVGLLQMARHRTPRVQFSISPSKTRSPNRIRDSNCKLVTQGWRYGTAVYYLNRDSSRSS